MSRKILNSNELLNSMGGGDAIIKILKKIGFFKFIDDSLGKRSSRAEYKYSEALVMWFVSVCSGAKRLENVYHYKIPLTNHPLLKKAISPDTLSYIIKELTVPNQTYNKSSKGKKAETESISMPNEVNNNNKLNRFLISSALKLGLIKAGVKYILDYDTTTIQTKIKGGRKIYNAEGKRGYAPALAVINNIPVYYENRNGDSNGRFRITETIIDTIDLLKEFGVLVGTVRVDGAAFSYGFIKAMNARKIRFLTRINSNIVVNHCAEIMDWIKSDKLKSNLASINYKLKDKVSRIVAERKYDYLGGIITNDFKSPEEEIISLYRARGDAENVFRSLKGEFGWDVLPMRRLDYNSTYMAIQAFCFQIFKYLTRKISKKLSFVKENMALKTFISEFMNVVTKWVGENLMFIHSIRDYTPLSGYT